MRGTVSLLIIGGIVGGIIGGAASWLAAHRGTGSVDGVVAPSYRDSGTGEATTSAAASTPTPIPTPASTAAPASTPPGTPAADHPPTRDEIMSLVSTDPARALELLSEQDTAAENALLEVIATIVVRDPSRTEALADRLLARTDDRGLHTLATLMTAWAQADPERAGDWVVARGAAVDAGVVAGVAWTAARHDPAAAATRADRLPAGLRDVWIAEVAGPYAAHDLEAAAGWLAQHRGETVHADAFRAVIGQAAQTDPPRAAELLARETPDHELASAATLAMSWSLQDPAAAARWSASLRDPQARSSAIRLAAAGWAARDPAAAGNWAQGLPAGDAREEALAAVRGRAAARP